MLPSHFLFPDYHGHWSRRAKAARELREAAGYCASVERKRWLDYHEKAELSITFVVRDASYYKDPDDALASLKPAIDGCVDAGVILDDSSEHLSYRLPIMYVVDKEKAPMTILDFKEV
ncbi:hypothetical protein ES708_28491 [subsurface metagenome]